MTIATIAEAIADFQAGKFIIIVDDPSRENEGDLCIAAQFATPQAINFMAQAGRGLICVALPAERLAALQIPLMVPVGDNSSGFGTAFTVSVEAKAGVTTGISAFDRAHTIQTLVNPATTPADIARPGHIFPLQVQAGGVVVRRGQTEASHDLAQLAGLYPAAVICEIMSADGSMARLPELSVFALQHGIKIITISDLVQYRYQHEQFLEFVTQAKLPTLHGDFEIYAYRDTIKGDEYLALVYGQPQQMSQPALVRIHSECLTGDALGSQRCDCRAQLLEAQRRVVAEGAGVILYLRQEGRGIGLLNKLRAYHLQDQGLDTVQANEQLGFPADARDYGMAAQLLRVLGLDTVRLLTNNPRKVAGLMQYGIRVVERVPHIISANINNEFYLDTKKTKLGHLIP
jgi:3,4-dihydroxy 2-butanone 4-phosphate synthase/GTP cyclohydrolase II